VRSERPDSAEAQPLRFRLESIDDEERFDDVINLEEQML
jgi:hypothetical protein